MSSVVVNAAAAAADVVVVRPVAGPEICSQLWFYNFGLSFDAKKEFTFGPTPNFSNDSHRISR